MFLSQILEKLIARRNLTSDECEKVARKLAKGVDPHQAAAFLSLLRSKGETADELAGIVLAMRELMIPVPLSSPALDIVGTGGDQSNSVNISTGASLLAASAGVKIAKHGNRAASSKCGSADVLEALGISFEADPEKLADRIEKVGMGFMFAPYFHPAMKRIAPIRKGLQIRQGLRHPVRPGIPLRHAFNNHQKFCQASGVALVYPPARGIIKETPETGGSSGRMIISAPYTWKSRRKSRLPHGRDKANP